MIAAATINSTSNRLTATIAGQSGSQPAKVDAMGRQVCSSMLASRADAAEIIFSRQWILRWWQLSELECCFTGFATKRALIGVANTKQILHGFVYASSAFTWPKL